MLNRVEYRQMLLAGTVTFPATFPHVGRLELRSETLSVLSGKSEDLLAVIETPSARVTLCRQVLASSVRAVFLPRDPQHVNYADGIWLLPGEIVLGLKLQLQNANGLLYGIVFVAECEPSILTMSAGMTAAESVQYYPPLPGDPSHNHYNPFPGGRTPGDRSLRDCTGDCNPSPCTFTDRPPHSGSVSVLFSDCDASQSQLQGASAAPFGQEFMMFQQAPDVLRPSCT